MESRTWVQEPVSEVGRPGPGGGDMAGLKEDWKRVIGKEGEERKGQEAGVGQRVQKGICSEGWAVRGEATT